MIETLNELVKEKGAAVLGYLCGHAASGRYRQ